MGSSSERNVLEHRDNRSHLPFVQWWLQTWVDRVPSELQGALRFTAQKHVSKAQHPSRVTPRLAEDTELIGEYKGSGFREQPYLARRADGQVIQLSRLLYLVAAEMDGRRSFEQIAERVSQGFGRGLSADNVRFLVDEKLRPLGMVAVADDESPKLQRANPLLGLKFRVRLVHAGAVRPITTVFWPLFLPPVVIAVLGGFVALDVWLFFIHGLKQSVGEIIYQPSLSLMFVGLWVISAAFHECGHATACRYSGAKPGPIGAGIYIIWFVFYSDVTDAYRLGKVGRLRTDFGGIYFDLIFTLAMAGAYFLTGFEPLLAGILIIQLDILNELMPFLRLDGYYILSDLTGVPDLFGRIKPILRSLIPGKGMGEEVKELKPWVRAVVIVWVLATVPILLYIFAMLFAYAPWLLANAWNSFLMHFGKISRAFGDGTIVEGLAGLVNVGAIVFPALGVILILALIVRRWGVAAWTRSKGKPLLRTGFIVGALIAGVIVATTFAQGPQLSSGGKGIPDGVQTFEIKIAEPVHVQTPVSYPQSPPVGGKHSPIWQNCGFYNAPIAKENAVHSLEHGAVWIAYRPNLAAEQVDVLRQLAQRQTHVLVSPYPDLPAPVVASAWGHQLRLNSAHQPRLGQFVGAFRLSPQAPEPNASCTRGTGQPAATHKFWSGFGGGEKAKGLAGLVNVGAIVFPALGVILILALIVRRWGVAAWTRSKGKPLLRNETTKVEAIRHQLANIADSDKELIKLVFGWLPRYYPNHYLALRYTYLGEHEAIGSVRRIERLAKKGNRDAADILLHVQEAQELVADELDRRDLTLVYPTRSEAHESE